MTDRELMQEEEERVLRPEAARSARSAGRLIPEPPCLWRTDFQRDRDRIIHAKAFRRLSYKTQVFLAPEGDHYRTRLTHTLEVAQTARCIAQLLRLNMDLTEAIALGHDLGHTPFGHAGEAALNALLPGGFRHNEQSLRVVDLIERGDYPFPGLNLTAEVRDGILRHTGPDEPCTWEGQVVRLADRMTYLNHDIDDALRGGLIDSADLPDDILRILGTTCRQRLATWVADTVVATRSSGRIAQSESVGAATDQLRRFMFDRVYEGSAAKLEEKKVALMLGALYGYLRSHPGELPDSPEKDLDRRTADYIAGMTDRYAVTEFRRLFVPSGWEG